MGSVNFAPAIRASGFGEGMLRSGNTELEIFEVFGEHDLETALLIFSRPRSWEDHGA
jgi:hypothetical protein